LEPRCYQRPDTSFDNALMNSAAAVSALLAIRATAFSRDGCTPTTADLAGRVAL